MNISDFPETVDRLTRRKGEMLGNQVVGVVYTLNRAMRSHKKYGALADVPFRVVQEQASLKVFIGDRPFRVVENPTEAAVFLQAAFDSECIRIGLKDASRHVRQPPETSVFKNPRSS